MVDSTLFIGTIIVAVVEFIKYFVPKLAGPVTIAVAAVVGLAVALLDTHIGLTDITVAQGILIGLSSSGVVAVAGKVSTVRTASTPVVGGPTNTRGAKL